jgi:predicted ferric reductase
LTPSKLRKINLTRFLILSLAFASFATTISIFVFNGGFRQLGDLAAVLYATTRLAALFATNLLLIHILLVAPEGATDLERLLEIAPKLAESDVYVCGPTAWTKAVERTLKNAGTPTKQVHTEQYSW